MNPFLESAVAEPQAVPGPVGVSSGGQLPPWRRLASGLVVAAGLGLGVASTTLPVAASPPPVSAGAGVNVNIATVAQLVAIKGIGPKTAALIVSERERAGPYVSFQDFAERIKGIGPKRAAALRDAGVTVSSSPPPAR